MQSCQRVSDFTVHLIVLKCREIKCFGFCFFFYWLKRSLSASVKLGRTSPFFSTVLRSWSKGFNCTWKSSWGVLFCYARQELQPCKASTAQRMKTVFSPSPPQVVRCLLWECGYSATARQASETDGLFLLLFLLSFKDRSHTLSSPMVLKMQKCSKIPTLQQSSEEDLNSKTIFKTFRTWCIN